MVRGSEGTRACNTVIDMTDVVFPCLNEAAALPGLLAQIPPGWHPIVADNGSTDDSAEIARDHGATVVHVAQRGYGAAVNGGLEAATSPIVAFMDADGSLDPGILPTLWTRFQDESADLVLGRRMPTTRGAFPAHARLGNAVITRQLRRRCGVKLHDLGPVRLARRDALLRLAIQDRRFGYPLELIISAARADWRIREVDVAYYPRTAGTRSKVTGTLLGTARTVRDMRKAMSR